MQRSLIVLCIVGLFCQAPALAQYRQYQPSYNQPVSDWSRNLVTDSEHDFSTVARASKHEHTFTFVNPTKSDMVLSSVRASCGCATPKILTRTVKPGEIAKLHVRFNTLAFLGQRRAKITLTVTSPRYVELYFNIKGHVRKDVVVSPGKVDFGQQLVGQKVKQSVVVKYAGKTDWKITDVRSDNPNLTAKLTETKRQNGLVSYQLDVFHSGDSKAGYLNDQLVIVTNDLSSKELPISVAGYMRPAIETSSIVDVGEIMQGKKLKRKIVLRSTEAFAVLDAKCASDAITLAPSNKSSKMHILSVEIKADKEGKISEEIVITTDSAAQKETKVQIIGNVIRSVVVNNE